MACLLGQVDSYLHTGPAMASVSVPTKKALRMLIKKRVLGLNPAMRHEQSIALTRKITSHPEYAKASRIALFISMTDEINTAPIFTDAFKAGK